MAGIPLPVAREYHRSTAIISAIIVPTAADLGYGIEFVADQGVIRTGNIKSPFKLRSFSNLDQLRNVPILTFHQKIVDCLTRPQKEKKDGCQITLKELAPEF